MSGRQRGDGDRSAQWKTHWQAFLNHEVTGKQLVQQCFALVEEDHGKDALAKIRSAEGDLASLVGWGANPRIVIGLLLSRGDFRMSPDLLGEAFYDRDSELTKLSSPRYWIPILSKLEAAQGALRGFMATGAYRRVSAHPGQELEALVYPFARICQEVQHVDRDVATLIRSIREHRLDQADTVLKDLGLSVAIEKTSGKPGRKEGSGVPRESDYATLSLDSYFRKRTHRPNTRMLARLLHFAGLDRFPHLATASKGAMSSGGAMDEVNRLRKRIEYLRRDRELFASATLNLSFRESDYETRDPVDFGGGIWTPF